MRHCRTNSPPLRAGAGAGVSRVSGHSPLWLTPSPGLALKGEERFTNV